MAGEGETRGAGAAGAAACSVSLVLLKEFFLALLNDLLEICLKVSQTQPSNLPDVFWLFLRTAQVFYDFMRPLALLTLGLLGQFRWQIQVLGRFFLRTPL